jgi:hypothetical protein
MNVSSFDICSLYYDLKLILYTTWGLTNHMYNKYGGITPHNYNNVVNVQLGTLTTLRQARRADNLTAICEPIV